MGEQRFHNADDILMRLKSLDADDAPFTDLQLVCDDGTVAAHGLLMQLHSPVFRDALAATQERPVKVELPGFTAKHARALRSYLYSGSLAMAPLEAPGYLTLGIKLGIPHLKGLAEAQVIARTLSASTACDLLSLSRKNGCGALEDAVRAYIKTNTAACFSAPGFLNLDAAAVQSLVQEETLSIREEDLFRRVLAWAEAERDRQYAAEVAAFGAASAEAAGAAGFGSPVKAAGAPAEAGAAAESPARALFSPGSAAAASPRLASATSSNHLASIVVPGSDVDMRRRRDKVLASLLPFIRFPVLGAQIFAKTVVPADVLTTEETTSVLMGFIVPDVAARGKYRTTPRASVGSQFTWNVSRLASAGANDFAVAAVSDDARTVSVRHIDDEAKADAGVLSITPVAPQGGVAVPTTIAAPDAVLVAEQCFVAGQSTAYVTLWGATSVTIGVTTAGPEGAPDSAKTNADTLEAALAGPAHTHFEGVHLNASSGVTPAVHAGGAQVLSGSVHLRDGVTLAVSLDTDDRAIVVSQLPRASGVPGAPLVSAVPLARVHRLPHAPWRLTVAVAAAPSAGDVDGVVTISSVPPKGCAAVPTSASAAALGYLLSSPSAASAPVPASPAKAEAAAAPEQA